MSPSSARVLFGNRRQMLADLVEHYHAQDRATVERLRVAPFNPFVWYCLEDAPLYDSWAREPDLPNRIERPADLNSFPPPTKQVIVERSDELVRPEGEALGDHGRKHST